MGQKLRQQSEHRIAEMSKAGYKIKADERTRMRASGERVISVNSTREYTKSVNNRFLKYMEREYPEVNRVRSVTEEHIRGYAEDCLERGLKPSGVHGCIDRLNTIYDLKTPNISRRGQEMTKGRDDTQNSRPIALRSYSPELSNFAEGVGIRRSEYKELTYDCIKRDERGLYVEVEHGKGNKYQCQRILPENESKVEKILERPHAPEERIFSDREMNNEINLHEIRREVAQQSYSHYQERCETQEGREQLYEELKETWTSRNPDRELPRDFQLLERNGLEDKYECRGMNRQEFEQQGKDYTFDRLPTLAVSVNHLSHWRCDVTVQNYFK